VIVLTPEEMEEGRLCGGERLSRARRKSLKDKIGEPSLSSHVMGAQGERAAYKWLGEPWVCTTGLYGKPDVRGLQIRTVPRTGDGLKIRPSDGDRVPVVLIVQRPAAPDRLWIRGWIFAKEGRAIGEVRDPGNRGYPAVYVNPSDLRPIETLHRNDRARAAMSLPPLSET